jgi:hypothetical protein
MAGPTQPAAGPQYTAHDAPVLGDLPAESQKQLFFDSIIISSSCRNNFSQPLLLLLFLFFFREHQTLCIASDFGSWTYV